MAKKPTRISEVEGIVREKLSAMLKVRFMSSGADLVVAHRKSGEEFTRRFPLVSEDKRVVGAIRTDCYTPENHKGTRLPRALETCRWLELVDAEEKLLVLTDKQMHKELKHDLDGIIHPSIKILYVDL